VLTIGGERKEWRKEGWKEEEAQRRKHGRMRLARSGVGAPDIYL
jgi:hypothetical protein